MRRLLTLAAVVLLAFPAPAAAATSTVGTSTTTVDLGGLTLGDLQSGSLGSAGAAASSADAPASLARLALAGGEVVELSSADGGTVAPQEVDLAGLGTVRGGGLSAEADDVSARAAVDALQAQLTPLGVRLDLQDGLEAAVDRNSTGAANALSMTGLSVSLDDLLGADLLAELPLGVLLDLAGALGLDLEGLGLDQVDALLEEMKAGEALADQIDAARDALAAARSDLAAAQEDLAAAQQQATAAAAAVTAQEQLIADLQNQIGGLDCAVVAVLCSQLQAAQNELSAVQAAASSAEQLVGTATAALQAAQAAVPEAEEAVAALVDEADALLARLAELLAAIDALDLTAVLEQLRAGLAGVELLGVDRLAVEVASAATADSSAADAACAVEGVRVAGQSLPVDVCADLAGALEAVVAELLAVLEILPLAGGDGLPADVISITAPRLTVSEPNAVRDGARVAEARVEGIGLDVTPLALTDVAADELLGPLTAFVDGALAELAALPGIDSGAVTAALEDLVATVGALPAGELAGLSTAGLSLAPASIAATSEFATAQTGPGVTAPPGTGTDSPTAPPGELPATGGGIAAGVLLLAAGFFSVSWLRRRRA